MYYKRSPFLFTYWNERNKLVLYNYNTYTKAAVSEEIIKVLEILSDWKSTRQIFDSLNDFEKSNLRTALEQLVRLKAVHKKPLAREDYSISHITRWNPIDLAMQRQRSYARWSPNLRSKKKPPSATKHIKGLSSFSLPKITEQDKDQHRGTLYDILEERKSICEYGDSSIDLDNLSFFLYNCARIKKIFNTNTRLGTLTLRPYPSGGARYPLEIYPVNNKITGLQKGIYYYDPLKHQLVLLKRNSRYQKRFNKYLMEVQKPRINREPDVVFIITAVFARTMWKYENIGMSLIMNELGCLYQTMYLVATEMNFAPCPLGGTYETIVRDWLDLNWFDESHVGTFMLGKKKSDAKRVVNLKE